jgi:shikimate 5-dehydrogenase
MLLHQAAMQLELWTGVAAPVAAMRDVVAANFS